MSHTKKQNKNRAHLNRMKRNIAAEYKKAAGIYFKRTPRLTIGTPDKDKMPVIDLIGTGTVGCLSDEIGEHTLSWEVVSLTKGSYKLPFTFIVLYGARPKDGKEFSREDTCAYVDFVGEETLDPTSGMFEYGIGAVLMFSEDGLTSSVGIIGDVFDLDEHLDEAYLEKLGNRMFLAHRFAVNEKLSPVSTLITVVTGADIDCKVSAQLKVHELTATWMTLPETDADRHWELNGEEMMNNPPELSTFAQKVIEQIAKQASLIVGDA